MHHKTLFILGLFALLLLTSCDPSLRHTLYVENATSGNISVAREFGIQNPDTMEIGSGTTEVVSEDITIGSQDIPSPINSFFNSFEVWKGQDTCLFDPMQNQKWTVKTTKSGMFSPNYWHELTLTLEDEDF